jgi:L-threonylcarbamoyladenylate synthase
VPGADRAVAALNLSVQGDLAEAAANLFGYLRALDRAGARTIAVMSIPHHGLGEAINDRLRRAAMGRE